jgi:hypothetical protein
LRTVITRYNSRQLYVSLGNLTSVTIVRNERQFHVNFSKLTSSYYKI